MAEAAVICPQTETRHGGGDGGGGPPPPGRRLALLIHTILIAGSNNAPLAAARLVLPMIALTMGAGAQLVGILAALFSAAPIFFNVAVGRWADRSGTFGPILFSALLIVGASALFLLAPSVPVLLVVACMIGGGAMFSHVVAIRAVSECGAPSDRMRNLGVLVVFYSLFQFIGPIAAGSALEYYGTHAALWTIGGFGVVSVGMIALRLHNFTRTPKGGTEPPAPGRTAELLRLPDLRRWVVVSSLFSAVMTILPFILSLHALATGISAAQAGLLLGAYSIGALISRASIGIATRLFRAPVILIGALLSGGAIYAALPFVHAFQPLAVLCLVLGLALGIGVPIALSLIYAAAPPDRVNESVGLTMALTNFLQTSLPLALGVLASSLGVGPMAWTLTAAMLAVAVLVWGGRKR